MPCLPFATFITVEFVFGVNHGDHQDEQQEEIEGESEDSQEEVYPILHWLMRLLTPQLEDVVVLLEEG